jgi:hypothetical protein
MGGARLALDHDAEPADDGRDTPLAKGGRPMPQCNAECACCYEIRPSVGQDGRGAASSEVTDGGWWKGGACPVPAAG